MEKKKIIKEYLEPIAIAILIALFIRTFVVQAFKIPSSSMEPTLQVGDHLLVNKFIYGIKFPFIETKYFQFKKPQRGDIIVFVYPKDRSKDFIKRVIGTQGERVQIVHNKIYINNQLIEDPWGRYDERAPSTKYLQPMEIFGPVTVPVNSVFVLGDNRDNSQDSRFWGFVNVNEVKGKALIIYFSWDRYAENLLGKVRWVRFGKLIH
ncbi:MAG: signal peptidase I [Deltaproteobacteria bacterium RBG_19FT_COMBO_46_12]|jgi:signal peptidase I|nr:MAG: signal peptidase I [Deltaproteobacteria bacterium RBG_19FT_COMBO_46_12]